MDILDTWQEDDGEENVRFFKWNIESVFRDLLADERLAGCHTHLQGQYPGWRVCLNHISAEPDEVWVGKFPIFSLLCFDATFINLTSSVAVLYGLSIISLKYNIHYCNVISI